MSVGAWGETREPLIGVEEDDLKRGWLEVSGYQLDATLGSGQTFRWKRVTGGGGWEGVIHGRWVRLSQGHGGVEVWTVRGSAEAQTFDWIRRYLRVDEDLDAILAGFPNDPILEEAVARWRGLRLLRQDPWECLASFILSSTKRIPQIEQVVGLLCERHGEVVRAPSSSGLCYGFPAVERVAALSEEQLRTCKMGFRAPNLLACARRIESGELDLGRVGRMELEEARMELMKVPGVGPKIADCALLFGFGFERAFPVDVWVARVLRRYYFRGRAVPLPRLRAFVHRHFGEHAGYAQQYLFHHIRHLDLL